AGIGPKWMFDIDTLTKSMNYQQVVAENQSNDNACIKENLDAGKVEKETVSAQQYVLLPLWSTSSQDPQNTDDDAAFDVKENENDVHVSASGKFSSNSTNRVNAVSAPITAAGLNLTNNTNSFNTASPSVNAVSLNFRIARNSLSVDPSNYLDDQDMPKLEDIVYSDDEEDVGVEADLSNLETNIPVSPIPTTRFYKDHLVNQIISDLNSTPQTRSMTRMVKEQGGLHQINDEDFHTCMFACFLSQEEPKKVHTQEEGIDYDEVFAHVARIEAIWLFLAYASFMGFMVYKMDVKSDFLYGTTEEEVYVYQPLGFDDPDYLDKVYKVVKALYGLHQASRAWYETLANYLLENGFQRGKIDQTLFIKKQKGDILLVQVYVNDIIFGSTNKELCKAFERLIKDKFQMSSIGELSFFLGLQVKQKDDGIFISQDKYVAEVRKFSFTNVKSASTPIETEKPLLKDLDGEDMDVHIYRSMIRSLMYLTSSRPDIMFTVYACARFQVTPKVSHLHAVKRIFRYLKGKPHSYLWYPKDSPFNLVAYSDSEYAGASLDRKSTTGGCQFLGCRLISWKCKKQTVVATSSTEAEYLRTLIDGKKVVVTKDVIRRDLQLDDADGVACLPNEEIFIEIAQIGYANPPPKLTFYKAFFSAQWKFLIHTLVQCVSAKRNKLEKKKRLKSSGFKRLRRVCTSQRVESSAATVMGAQEDASKQGGRRLKPLMLMRISPCKGVSAAEPTVFDDEENMAAYKMEHFRGMTYDKVRTIFEREYKKVQTLFKPNKDVEEHKKKRVAKKTLLQESFKKLKIVEVSGSESTQEPSNDSKEISEEDVQNMLEIIPVSKFKVEALQVKYPIIDWEIHNEGSRTYWKIVRVGGITEAYQSFEDMLKGFDREDLVALWNLVKEKFSSAVPDLKKMHQGINAAVLSITATCSRLMLLGKVDTAAEVIEEFTLSGIKICSSQRTYSMETSKQVDTPMVEKSKLDKDPEGKAIDSTRYRGMFGALMYLTSSRPDLVFAVCICYSCIALIAFADADHAGCQDTKRTTSGNYQLADIFTKALPRKRLNFLIEKLGMKIMYSETLISLAEEDA
nr:putative ribonuclease H-like domain-containing protein [Tanacetum cinerariifolium]